MELVAVKERLRDLVAESLDAAGRDPIDGISDDEALPGILDSVVLSMLLASVEDEWDIELLDEEIEPEILESLSSLASFVILKDKER